MIVWKEGRRLTLPKMEVPQGKKLIFFQRHAESVYNKWRRESFTRLRIRDMLIFDPEERDPTLTERGRATTHYLSKLVSAEPKMGLVTKIFTSPLTRALETTAEMFGRHPTPKPTVLPVVTETVNTLSDTGKGMSDLEKLYPGFDFSEFGRGGGDTDCWWYTDPSAQLPFYRKTAKEPAAKGASRCKEFLQHVSAIEDSVVFVVTHSKMLKELAGGSKFSNLEVRAYMLDVSDLSLSPAP